MSGSRVYPRAQPNDAGQGRVSVDSFFRVPQVARFSQPHLMDRPFPAPSLRALEPTDQQHPEQLQRDVREQGHLSERTYQIQRQNLMVKKLSFPSAIEPKHVLIWLQNLLEMYSNMPVTSMIRAQSLRETQHRLDNLDRQHTRERTALAAQQNRLNEIANRSKSVQQRQHPQVRDHTDACPTDHLVKDHRQQHDIRSSPSAASSRKTAGVGDHGSGSLLRDAFGDAPSSQRDIASQHRRHNDSVLNHSRDVAVPGSSDSPTTYSGHNMSKALADARNALPLPTAGRQVPRDSQQARVREDTRSRLPLGEAREAKAQRSSEAFVPRLALSNSPSRGSNYPMNWHGSLWAGGAQPAEPARARPWNSPFGKPRTQAENQSDRHEVHHAQAAKLGKAALTDNLPHEFRQTSGSSLNVGSPDKDPHRQQADSSNFASSSILHPEVGKPAVSIQFAAGRTSPMHHESLPPPPNSPVNHSNVDNNSVPTSKSKISLKGIQSGNSTQVVSSPCPPSTKYHKAKPNLKLDTIICDSFPGDIKMKEDGSQIPNAVENLMDLPIACKATGDNVSTQVHSNDKDGDNQSLEHECAKQKPVDPVAGGTATINNANIDTPSTTGKIVEVNSESVSDSLESESSSNLNGNNKLEDDLENISLASEGSPSPDIDDQLDGTAWEKVDANGIEQDDEFYHQVANPQRVGWSETVRRGAWSWVR